MVNANLLVHYLTVHADLITAINVMLLLLFYTIYALLFSPNIYYTKQVGCNFIFCLDEKLDSYISGFYNYLTPKQFCNLKILH